MTYNCDMCGKEIDEEEYEDFGGVCEECYDEINEHYNEYGLDDEIRPYKDLIEDLDWFEVDEKDDLDDIFDRDFDDDSLDDFDEF